MSLFNLPVTHHSKKKVLPQHPWEKTIKDVYFNRMKYAHNDVRGNMKYPEEKAKFSMLGRTKFSVFGNRVTKEFIFCVKLVKGMHKYRPQRFDSPDIRAVTTVEWPAVLNELKIKYGGLAHCLNSQVAVLYNNQFLGGEQELKELIENNYIYHLRFNYEKESVAQFANFVKSSGRPCAYMHIMINEEHIGTMIFMLYADILPRTCENFLRLCKDTKGGYGGTPVHRIVKDGWIQCGGFGLKSASLNCENFIVPHDRRGVLSMANDGRDIDCSTQFFVLLQPAMWMAHKYVAFGQLIDGDNILQRIEEVSTWYEAPTSSIIIHTAGVLNLDCHDIMINPGANEYIESHIEDLILIGEIFIEELMINVFLEIEFRRIVGLEPKGGGEHVGEEGTNDSISETQIERYKRMKEEIKTQLEKSQLNSRRPTPAASRSSRVSRKNRSSRINKEEENNDFDVEDYDFEAEEYSYSQHQVSSASLVVRPRKPFYIPLTDVPYPDEKDSTFDLKKFVKGDYCLESDLEKITLEAPKTRYIEEHLSYLSEYLPNTPISSFNFDQDEQDDSVDLDSDEEMEIKQYIKMNVDRVSFAGGTVMNIVKRGMAMFDIFENVRKHELITDEALRRVRLASVSARLGQISRSADQHRKVSIKEPDCQRSLTPTKIKRRQTGFIRPDLDSISNFQKSSSEVAMDDSETRKVRIAAPTASTTKVALNRRSTAFTRVSHILCSSNTNVRQSVLRRLYDDAAYDDDNEMPTLKDYKPAGETHVKNILLTPVSQFKVEDSSEFIRASVTRDRRHEKQITQKESFEGVLSFHQAKKITRNISSDYVHSVQKLENGQSSSLRSIEFAKIRPTMSVAEYQKKTQAELEALQLPCGLRLPGDSPIYSPGLSPLPSPMLKNVSRVSRSMEE